MENKKIKNNIFLKIFLDIALIVVFILLMNSKIISLAFHEIAGLAIGAFFLVHKLLNLKWIKSVTKNIFGKKVTIETRIRYILDVLLLLGVYTIIISGIFMSQVLFPQATADNFTWRSIHTAFSYICIILIGLHIGLHWKWVMNGFSRMFKIKGENKIRKWLLRGAALGLAIWGLVGIILSGFFTNIGFNSLRGNSPGFHNNNIDEPFPSISPNNTTTDNEISDSSTITNDNSNTLKDDSTVSDSGSDTATDTVSLEKYLSGLNCTGCFKQCSLLYPQCNIGVKQQQQAIQEFGASNEASSEINGTTYTENGNNYLQLGDTIYTVSSSTNNADNVSISSDTTETDLADLPGGNNGGRPERNGNGLHLKEQTQSVFDVILTFTPIVGFFSVIGYLLKLLLNRKKGAINNKEE